MANQLNDSPTESLTGHLERVVFHNPDSGWGILHLRTEDDRRVTVAGVITAPAEGEHLRLQGAWEIHPRYGEQFRFEHYELLRPSAPEAIIRFLSGGLIKGIGPVLAGQIVERFGTDTLSVLDNQPERLTEVPGIGPKRAEALRRAWQEHEQQRNVLLFLYEHGLGPALSQRIFERYGPRAVEVVERQPYRLALDISGISFAIADRLACHQGIPEDDPQRLQAGLMHCLHQALGEGYFYLPLKRLVEQAQALTGTEAEQLRYALDLLATTGQVKLESDAQHELGVYLTALYRTEQQVAAGLRRLLDAGPGSLPSAEELDQWLTDQERFAGLELTEEQRQAVFAALRHPLCVITGGPGTGKTTIVRFLAHLGQQRGQRLALAAPTGRAAQRLEQITGHPASTLHRLLSWDPFRGKFRHGPGNPLPVDWLIVDEASMLEVPLAEQVLSALPEEAHLLLVGDADQLPSVGPGQFLADLMRSGQVPVARLQQIHRQAAGSLIVSNAHRINQGQSPHLPTPKTWQHEDCVFLERNDPPQAADKVVQLVAEGLPRMGFEAEEIQVITSLHRGPIGVRELNRRLQAAVNPPRGQPEIPRGETCFRQGDRVLQTVNNYDKMVYNGDIGQIMAMNLDEGHLVVCFEQGKVSYEGGELDQLELAYALTVHKAQGSEFPAVVLVVHSSHYVMLHRNLLYTGTSRAQRMLCLVGDRRGLHKALSTTHHSQRYTRLAQRLQGWPQ